MKASLKFRDEQKPLLRAKVPLNILGMPFQSGIVAGHSKELTLNLATFFESGPSFKVAYRPNDSLNPFSLIVKSGTGHFGSPFSSSMLMSCEFNLLGRHVSPSSPSPIFMLHFKPRFGDFSFKKSQSSIFDKKGCGSRNDDVLGEVVDSPIMESFSGDKVPILGSDSHVAGAIGNLFSGMDVAARTTLPVRGRAAVKFRWGVRVPAELKSSGITKPGISFRKVPFLVLDKIGVELLDSGDSKKKEKANVVAGAGSDLGFPVNADVAEACLMVKRQLVVLQKENVSLRNAMEDLRCEISGGGGSGKYREFERNGGKLSGGKSSEGRKNEKKSDFNAFGGQSTDGNASEELKKALNPSK